MRRSNFLVFDDYVVPSSSSFTDTELNHRIGAYDQFTVMCVIENLSITGSGGFNLYVAHSADARLWLYRSNESTTLPGAGDITLTSTQLGTQPYFAMSYEAGATPLLAFVRFEMKFGTGTSGNVKAYLTQRDQGG